MAGGPKSIDLSWEPNHESDLSGYLIYRSDLDGGETGTGPLRLNTTPVSGPSYQDDKVLPGHHYTYTVTSVDRNGNESKHSVPFSSTLVSP